MKGQYLERLSRLLLIPLSRQLIVLAAAALLVFLALPQSAHATAYTVTNNNDAGAGSLRAAIIAPGVSDTITFAPALSGMTITLMTGELLINKNLTITGPVGGITVNGNNSGRVFQVSPTTVTSATISGLTITNGNSSTGGGGVVNGGTLTLRSSTVTGNAASTLGGGGIFNYGKLDLIDSTVSNNTAVSGGGGIFNADGGLMTLTNSTVSGNSSSQGGGIYTRLGSATTLNNSTVAFNSATNGGGIYNSTTCSIPACPAQTVTVKNTIIANSPSGGDCGGPNPITSAGHNLDSDSSCFSGATDLHMNPRLGPLANNGGPTETHALCTGPAAPHPSCGAASPAINQIPDPPDCTDTAGNHIDTDQRGVTRPQPAAGKCDIGAYEVCTCVTPPPGLEHWWPLDERSGSIANNISDPSHLGNTMFGPGAGSSTSLNTGIGPTSLPGQKVANSFEFGGTLVGGALPVSGAQSFVSVPDPSGILSYGNPGSAFTIDAWIRVDPADASGVHTIVDKRLEQVPPTSPPSCPPTGPEKHLHGYSFYLSSGNLGFELADDSAPCSASPTFCATSTVTSSCTNYTSGLYVATGDWVHVAATVSRAGTPPGQGVINLYADGGPPATFLTDRTGNLNNSAALLIGKGYPIVIPDTYFKGDIDEVEIFNRALSQPEIQTIVSADNAGKCKPSVGGIVGLTVSSSASPIPWAPLAAVAAAALAVLGAGGWYARRRWLG